MAVRAEAVFTAWMRKRRRQPFRLRALPTAGILLIRNSRLLGLTGTQSKLLTLVVGMKELKPPPLVTEQFKALAETR